MWKWFRWILISIAILLIVSLVWALVWGPLFAWGPKWGYVREEHNGVILFAKDKELFNSISDIDQIMSEEEDFHGLEYKRKVIIVFANNKWEWKMFFPYLPSGVGGAGLQTGNAVFINYPKVSSHNYNIDGFVKHELSHTILYQNSGLLNAYRMYKQFWVEEGIATYFGGPWDYYSSKDEYLSAFSSANLAISDDPLVLYDGLRQQGGKLSYTTYRYFFEYLANTYGTESLKKFINLYCKNPGNMENDFKDAFGINVIEAVKKFNVEINDQSVNQM